MGNNDRKLSIREVAKQMGKSEQFVRVGLQRGILPIGTAVQLSTRYTYYISPKLLKEYIGVNHCLTSKEYDKIEQV